ncbi:hypothetical protein GOODEAATRI_023733, partial [Goodea atripinnis]
LLSQKLTQLSERQCSSGCISPLGSESSLSVKASYTTEAEQLVSYRPAVPASAFRAQRFSTAEPELMPAPMARTRLR